MSVSEQLQTYPSLNPTLTLTCYQLNVVELGRGWCTVTYILTFILQLSLNEFQFKVIVNLFELMFLFPDTLLVIVLQQRRCKSNQFKIILTENYFKARHVTSFLLTEWEG